MGLTARRGTTREDRLLEGRSVACGGIPNLRPGLPWPSWGHAAVSAQQVFRRPANVSDQEIVQAVQQQGMGWLVATEIRESGLTPNQMGTPLQAACYSPSLLDQYHGAETYSANVQPGARIVVPKVPDGEEKTNWGQIVSRVAPILADALTIVLVVQRL